MNYPTLKQRHRQERNGQPQALSLRLHRALSWLNRAEQAEDADGRFIFLWIAFNAAYASEMEDSERLSEKSAFRSFLDKLCELDPDKRIGGLVWQEFSGSIRLLLDNPYVFQPHWDWCNGKISASDWETRFTRARKKAQFALASSDTAEVLDVVFQRIYTLRNQLMHGGATWDGKVNREQLRDCVNLLGKLVPLIIELMMDNPQTDWGVVCYPVVDAQG